MFYNYKIYNFLLILSKIYYDFWKSNKDLFSHLDVWLLKFWNFLRFQTHTFVAMIVVWTTLIGMYDLRDHITCRRSSDRLSIDNDRFMGCKAVFLVSRWFSFPQSSARTTTSRYGRHNNAWRNSGVESSLPPPMCNDVTGKWNSRKPGHTHIVFVALSRADRRRTLFNSGLDAFPSSLWN